MKYFILMLTLLTVNVLHAAKYKVQINDIDIGRNGEPHLLMMSDGHVGYLDSKDKLSLDDLMSAKDRGETVELDLDDRQQVQSYHVVAPEKKLISSSLGGEDKNMSYEPSVISVGDAQAVLSRMRRNYQNQSQCYNRAHVWTYEEFQRSGLKSYKVFMFFTRKYIRNYNYFWWFHVTPVVQTPEGLRTLDRRYTTAPLTLTTWARKFVYSGRPCPLVPKYSDYRDHQYEQDCYHIAVPMYFWQPYDIEQRDRTGYQKTRFIQSNVNYAYSEAF